MRTRLSINFFCRSNKNLPKVITELHSLAIPKCSASAIKRKGKTYINSKCEGKKSKNTGGPLICHKALLQGHKKL